MFTECINILSLPQIGYWLNCVMKLIIKNLCLSSLPVSQQRFRWQVPAKYNQHMQSISEAPTGCFPDRQLRYRMGEMRGGPSGVRIGDRRKGRRRTKWRAADVFPRTGASTCRCASCCSLVAAQWDLVETRTGQIRARATVPGSDSTGTGRAESSPIATMAGHLS